MNVIAKKTVKFIKWSGITIVGLAALLTAYFYIGGIEWGDWTIPDEAELRLELRDVPDEDNAYIALMALTNLYNVAEGDDESAEISDKTFVRLYGNPFFRDGDNDEREKWAAVRSDPASRGRAEKLLAGNARFFEAFRPALRRKDFQTAGAGEPEGNPFLVQLPLLKPIMDFSMLAGLKVQAGLERGDTEAAAADIADIHALGQMMAARIGPDSNGFVQFMVGKLLVKIAYGKMCDAVAMGKATGEMLQEFRKMLDEDEASAPAGRERALKAAWERRFLGVDWYCDHPFWLIPDFHDIDLEKGTVTPTILCRILSNWPGYARFAYHRREMKFMEAAALRAALAGKTESYVGDNELRCGWWTALVPGGAGRFEAISLSPFLEPYFKEDALVRSRARLVLATEKWRMVHGGENPPSLDALVPDYLAAVPADPWDKSGGPIKYDAESGVAWSVGKEGEYDYRKIAKERKPADADKPLDGDTQKYAFRLDAEPIGTLAASTSSTSTIPAEPIRVQADESQSANVEAAYASEAIPVIENLRMRIALYQYEKAALPCIWGRAVKDPRIETWMPQADGRYIPAYSSFSGDTPPLEPAGYERPDVETDKERDVWTRLNVGYLDLSGKLSKPNHYQYLAMLNNDLANYAYLVGCFGDGDGLPKGTGYAVCEIVICARNRKYIGTWKRYKSVGKTPADGDVQVCFTSGTARPGGDADPSHTCGCFVPDKASFDKMAGVDGEPVELDMIDKMKKYGWEFSRPARRAVKGFSQ